MGRRPLAPGGLRPSPAQGGPLLWGNSRRSHPARAPVPPEKLAVSEEIRVSLRSQFSLMLPFLTAFLAILPLQFPDIKSSATGDCRGQIHGQHAPVEVPVVLR